MATASATRTLVLRSELGTDAKRNQHTLNGGRTRKFYPQSLLATRSRPTLGWCFFVRGCWRIAVITVESVRTGLSSSEFRLISAHVLEPRLLAL